MFGNEPAWEKLREEAVEAAKDKPKLPRRGLRIRSYTRLWTPRDPSVPPPQGTPALRRRIADDGYDWFYRANVV